MTVEIELDAINFKKTTNMDKVLGCFKKALDEIDLEMSSAPMNDGVIVKAAKIAINFVFKCSTEEYSREAFKARISQEVYDIVYCKFLEYQWEMLGQDYAEKDTLAGHRKISDFKDLFWELLHQIVIEALIEEIEANKSRMKIAAHLPLIIKDISTAFAGE